MTPGIIEIVLKKVLDVSYFKAEHLLVVLTLFMIFISLSLRNFYEREKVKS